MQVIHVGCDSTGGGDGASTCLLAGVAHGLLRPSVPLSDAAACQLTQTAGTMLRSLPTELLYDRAGLAIYDKITQLHSYYLTQAEAGILATSGADIVRSCCVQDGSLLLELGAGSMRKTRLLLEAVQSARHTGVTFAALDLCAHSLTEALTGLQGCCDSSSVRLIGLVGTYNDGLDWIAQQDSQQQQEKQQQVARQGGLFEAAPAGPEEEDEDEEPAACVDSTSSNSTSDLTSSSASGDTTAAAAAAAAAAPAGPFGSAGGLQLLPAAAPRVILWLGSSIGNSDRQQAVSFLRQVKDKALRAGDFLLIGIDRRNDSQTVAAAYNDKQGVTRDFILNGLHHCKRLLDGALFQAAASEAPRPEPSAPAGSTTTSSTAASAASGSSSSSSTSSAGISAQPSQQTACASQPCSSLSLDPGAFSYFSLYNEEEGRHEAYYRAQVATSIKLPAALADLCAADGGLRSVGSSSSSSGGGRSGCVSVPVAAGEVISIEFSYKYSTQEVQQLAEAAGLLRVKAWSDARQRYDLHLMQAPPA